MGASPSAQPANQPSQWVTRALGIAGLLLVAAVVGLVPLVFSRTTIEAGRVKLLALEMLTLGLAALWVAGRLEGQRNVTWRSPLTLPVLALLLANLLSLLFSGFPAASAREIWRVSILLVLFLAVQDTARQPWQRWALVGVALAAASGVCA